MFSRHVKIKIDRALFDRLAAAARQTGYASTEEMIKRVLEKAAGDEQRRHEDAEADRQLRGLGYLE